MPPSTFYFQFKIVKLSFYSRPENFFWGYEIGECVYEIQKCMPFNPSVHRQGVVAAVQIEQPCGVNPAVELILQTDWLYFVNTAAG